MRYERFQKKTDDDDYNGYTETNAALDQVGGMVQVRTLVTDK